MPSTTVHTVVPKEFDFTNPSIFLEIFSLFFGIIFLVKTLFYLSILIAIGSSIFAEPLKFYIASQQAGFPIEKLTYLPNSYTDVAEGIYFELRSDVSTNRFVSVTFGSGGEYLRFTQSGNDGKLNLYLDGLEPGSYYSQENLEIEGKTVTVTYFRNDLRRFVWRSQDKRYELTTNDLTLSLNEAERIEAGLAVIKIDFLKPLRQSRDRLLSLIESF